MINEGQGCPDHWWGNARMGEPIKLIKQGGFMLDPICQIEGVPHYIVILGVALIEFWLGKTEKTKSGSIVELILNLVKSTINKAKGKING